MNVNVLVGVQLERIGFFVVDQDTTPELLVLNRTVTLREAAGKGTAPPGKSRKEEQVTIRLIFFVQVRTHQLA